MADKGGRRRRSSSSSNNSGTGAGAGTAAGAAAAAAEGAGAEGAGEAMLGCSPSSLNSPMSSLNGSAGGDGNGAGRSSSGTGFERNCSLDKFMETLGALSPPDGRHFHLDKRQVRADDITMDVILTHSHSNTQFQDHKKTGGRHIAAPVPPNLTGWLLTTYMM